jgi:hypothetical protein
MRQAIAHRLAAYAAWCDRAPADTGARVAGAAVLAAKRLKLPAGVCVGCAALAGFCVAVALAVDLAPKRAVSLRLARLLHRPFC